MNYIIILFKTNRNYPERVSSCPKLNKIREKNNLLFTLFLQLQLLLSLCCVETRYTSMGSGGEKKKKMEGGLVHSLLIFLCISRGLEVIISKNEKIG